MIQLIPRKEVFYRSLLADRYISDLQQMDCCYVDEYGEPKYSDEELDSLLSDVNDHVEPFCNDESPTNDFAVLGYPRQNIINYVAGRSKSLIHFFKIMHIRRFYLMDEKRYDWLSFPFESREKTAAVKNLVNAPSYREAFEADIEELAFLLPLFHSSGRYNTGIVYFFSANNQVPIAMFLCDDGNFHTSFCQEDREKIFYAASAAGLVMGGVEVCSDMYNT